MSDELTAELRRVYDEAYHSAWAASCRGGPIGQPNDYTRTAAENAALLAVARHSAERQRGMEATPEMELAAAVLDQDDNLCAVYRAMRSAAPLWVDKK